MSHIAVEVDRTTASRWSSKESFGSLAVSLSSFNLFNFASARSRRRLAASSRHAAALSCGPGCRFTSASMPALELAFR
eukprot:2059625-Pyramimonas_sp.AAC.1